jgi:hypothetical protein
MEEAFVKRRNCPAHFQRRPGLWGGTIFLIYIFFLGIFSILKRHHCLAVDQPPDTYELIHTPPPPPPNTSTFPTLQTSSSFAVKRGLKQGCGSGSASGSRSTRIQEVKNDPQKYKKVKYFHVLKCCMFSFGS